MKPIYTTIEKSSLISASIKGGEFKNSRVLFVKISLTKKRKLIFFFSYGKLLGWLEEEAEEGNGNPFQYSCLENPMDRGAWKATVHGLERVGHNLVTKQTTT